MGKANVAGAALVVAATAAATNAATVVAIRPITKYDKVKVLSPNQFRRLTGVRQPSLPGKKSLPKSDMVIEVALIDASETPVERPKKDNGVSTQGRRSVIPLKAK